MGAYNFLIETLAVWRVTHLLNAENGPADLLVWVRRMAGTGFWGQLLDCFYCLSLWIAAPFALLLVKPWCERFLVWLALSAGAIVLERLTKVHEPQTASYWEEEDANHGMLRQQPTEMGTRGQLVEIEPGRPGNDSD